MLKADYPISPDSNFEESESLSSPNFHEGETVDTGNENIPRNLGEIIFSIFRPIAPFLLVAAFLVLAGVLFLVERSESLPAEEAIIDFPIEGVPRENNFSYRAADLTRDVQLKDSLMEERGGRLFLSGLRSLRYSGAFVSGDQREFTILTMAPNRALFQLSGEGGHFSLGFDGTDFWKVVRTDGGSRKAVEPTAAEMNLLRALGGVHGPLLGEFMDGNVAVASVEDIEENLRSVIRVRFTRSDRVRAEEVDLDPENLDLLRWQSEDEEGNVSVVRYRGYRELGGFDHPTEIELWRNGEKEFDLRIATVVPNFGAVRLLFQNPDLSESS